MRCWLEDSNTIRGAGVSGILQVFAAADTTDYNITSCEMGAACPNLVRGACRPKERHNVSQILLERGTTPHSGFLLIVRKAWRRVRGRSISWLQLSFPSYTHETIFHMHAGAFTPYFERNERKLFNSTPDQFVFNQNQSQSS
jgi:hypothetical protein